MPTEASLPTALWLTAELRRLQHAGYFVYLVRQGEAERGQVLVRLNLMGTADVIVQTIGRDAKDQKIWLNSHHDAFITAKVADDITAKAIKADPDVWVIEIDVKTGDNPITLLSP
jgi:hypothetical protein